MCLACEWAITIKSKEAVVHGWTPFTPTRREVIGTGLAFAVASVALTGSRASAQSAGGETGIVFRNGVVHTVVDGAPQAPAVVVEGNTIVYVGDDAGAVAYQKPGMREVDLEGRMLMPGFVEAHIHPLVGSVITNGVDLQFDTREETLAALRAYRDQSADKEVIRGFGWRYTAFPDTGPVKEDLDEIWPDKPVILYAIDGHSGWANSKALEIAGIDKDSPEPQPGFSFFQRDPETNEPTGWLVEVAAMFTVVMGVAPYTDEYVVEAVTEWLPRASAAGITSLFDAGIILIPEEDGLEIYSQLEQAGKLPFRVIGSFHHFDPEVDPVPITVGLKERFNSDLVKANVLKINVDGGDAQRTAAMLAPYSDAPDISGDTILPPDVMMDTVQRADAAGLDMHFHSFGDRGIRVALDALENATKTNPARDRRHTMAHLVLVDDADLPRFADLGVIGQFSTQWAVPDHFWKGVTSVRWGDERAAKTYRFGSHLRSGARLTLGTDWPAASHYSTYKPLEAIQIAMTRQELGKEGSTEPLAPADERISLAEAIRANTIDAAYQLGLDTLAGTIEVGKRADLIVLEKNLFDLDPAEVGSTRIVMTLMDGQIRHEAS
ncbi:MAG: amidohydrolase [Sedimentitalea sp.]|nr:amidohydrolase [Sedimentitalea sp.]